MNVVTAYKWQMSGKGVVITILDDGIEKDHPDLSRNYVCVLLLSTLLLSGCFMFTIFICAVCKHSDTQSTDIEWFLY